LFGKISASIAMETRQVKLGFCVSIVTEKCDQYVELRVLNVMEFLGLQEFDDWLT
jgi:hypothetical protein